MLGTGKAALRRSSGRRNMLPLLTFGCWLSRVGRSMDGVGEEPRLPNESLATPRIGV